MDTINTNKISRIGIILFCFIVEAGAQISTTREDPNFPYKYLPNVFPGSKQLTWEGDLSLKMLDGAHQFIEEKIDQSFTNRSKLWSRDFRSTMAYEKSIEPNRQRFLQYIGVKNSMESFSNQTVGPDKHPVVYMQKISINHDPELIAETTRYKVYQVRWPVLEGVYGEGILIQPKSNAVANIIAIPDADQTPEQLMGLSPGIPLESQFARHLAENGFQVLIPVLISRTFMFPGEYQQQTYREWIYRQAFHMGKHIIGFEVQKVIAAIDWFKLMNDQDKKIGVAGYNEGGLIAFYAAAADKRVDAVLVSGYFNSRQQVWDEPIYRNVWGLLSEFGDAEIATLIAPRSLIIEHSTIPEVIERIEDAEGKQLQVGGLPYTGYKGRLRTPQYASVKREYDRIDALIKPGFQLKNLVNGPQNAPVSFGSLPALEIFTKSLGYHSSLTISSDLPTDSRSASDPVARQMRQLREMEDHIQWLVRDSDHTRNQFFLYKVMPEFAQRRWSPKAYHTYYASDHFVDEAESYRKYFQEEILGKFDDALLPPNPQTRKIYDKERWTGFEVVLDVYPNLFATGILLIPKDVKPGERRPVVVTQHGRNSTPHELVEGNKDYYNDAAAKLADQGFIVFVPQNPYRGEDRYRWLDRKANTLKKTLFSFIVSQHDQTLRWLGTLPFVDKNRIAFYGLSYGGETAMRVPSVLEGYCLSICSGDFGDWTRKVADTHNKISFMNTLEWEMPYFNMGNTFSYAEMAYLIFPRPFMVERGHDDLVQPDEWVSYEYGKVRYLYDKFNLEDKTTIEFFNGGHSMRNEGTFKFLHSHLHWP